MRITESELKRIIKEETVYAVNQNIRRQFAEEIKPFVSATMNHLSENSKKCVKNTINENMVCKNVANKLSLRTINEINEMFDNSDMYELATEAIKCELLKGKKNINETKELKTVLNELNEGKRYLY